MAVYNVKDARAGCPAKAAARSKLIQTTFSLTAKSLLMVSGHMIRSAVGRSDLNLYMDGAKMDDGLTYTPSKQWADAHVFWSGVVDAGSHVAWLQSPTADAWGCTGSANGWGDITVVAIPYVAGINAYQTADARVGCPAIAAANSRLIQTTVTVTTKSLVTATGHMIRKYRGRADLQLMLDGTKVDDTLTFTSSSQWADAAVYWSGMISVGTHTFWLQSNKPNIWGCQVDRWAPKRGGQNCLPVLKKRMSLFSRRKPVRGRADIS